MKKVKIAFVCNANSTRSQISEAIAKKIVKDHNLDIEVYSAGLNPASYVNPMAIRILEEDQISTENLYPKNFDQIPTEQIDLFIILCEDECPILPEAKVLRWYTPHPFSYEDFYVTREKLKLKIKELFLNIDKYLKE